MASAKYLAAIQTLYDGEVMGEALLLSLCEVARNARQRHQFGTVLQLETETKARLRPLLAKYGLSFSETFDPDERTRRVTDYTDTDWPGYMAATAARLSGIVRRYERIARRAPKGDRVVLDAVAAHEAAILDWAEREARGPSEQSLDLILALLHFPLQPRKTDGFVARAIATLFRRRRAGV